MEKEEQQVNNKEEEEEQTDKEKNEELTEEEVKCILENMIPFVITRKHIFVNHEKHSDIKQDYRNESGEWSKIVGKVITETMHKESREDIKISECQGKIIIRYEFVTPGTYEIEGVKYSEIELETVHPSGTFFFHTFFSEVWRVLPEEYKQMVMNGTKIYVSTKGERLTTEKDHKGRTKILFPVADKKSEEAIFFQKVDEATEQTVKKMRGNTSAV